MTSPEPPSPPWSRTNRLIAQAAERLGARLQPCSPQHTDHLAILEGGGRRVWIAKTRSPYLSQVAQTLCNDKFRSRERLRAAGISCIEAELLDEQQLDESSLCEQVLERALAAHGAVTIKPNSANRALGVCVGIDSVAAGLRALAHARAHDRDEEVLIEPTLSGVDMRISVVGGRAVAAAAVHRPTIVGDGATTPRQGIAKINRDARRGSWRSPGLQSLDELEVDDAWESWMEVMGTGLDRPLPAGRSLVLVGEEEAIVDWTDAIARGWLALAERASLCLGVDVAGIDLRGPAAAFERDPEVGDGAAAALLEVNALPALHLHALPTQGQPRPVFEAFVTYCLQLPGAPPAITGPDA